MRNDGFTLVELVIVILIIGILAAVAMPRFLNLSTAAQSAATRAIAGSLSTANAENYAARSVSPVLGSRVRNCRQVANLLMGNLPNGYTITSLAIAVNATVTCTLRGPSTTTATFTGTGIQ